MAGGRSRLWLVMVQAERAMLRMAHIAAARGVFYPLRQVAVFVGVKSANNHIALCCALLNRLPFRNLFFFHDCSIRTKYCREYPWRRRSFPMPVRCLDLSGHHGEAGTEILDATNCIISARLLCGSPRWLPKEVAGPSPQRYHWAIEVADDLTAAFRPCGRPGCRREADHDHFSRIGPGKPGSLSRRSHSRRHSPKP